MRGVSFASLALLALSFSRSTAAAKSPFSSSSSMASSDGLLVSGIDGEDLVVVTETLVVVAHLLSGQHRRRVEVFDLLLRVVDEVGEFEHDLHQFLPVLLFAVELHQACEQLAIVRTFVEGGDEALRRECTVAELARRDFAEFDEQREAHFAGRDVQVTRLGVHDLGPVPRRLVSL